MALDCLLAAYDTGLRIAADTVLVVFLELLKLESVKLRVCFQSQRDEISIEPEFEPTHHSSGGAKYALLEQFMSLLRSFRVLLELGSINISSLWD